MAVFVLILAFVLMPLMPAGAQAAPPSAPVPSPGAAPQAKTLTLAQVVAIAVNGNTSVVLARQRLQQAQELINQVNAQGRPQSRADVADTYSSYGATTASLPTATIAAPAIPGGTTIPTITDQAGGVSTGFNATIGVATGASTLGTTTTTSTSPIGGIGTGSSGSQPTGLNGSLPTSATPGTSTTGTTTTPASPITSTPTTPGTPTGAGTPGTTAPGAGTTSPGNPTSPGGATAPGSAAPSTGTGTGTSGTSAPSGASGTSGASSAVPQAAPAQIALAPLPSIVQQFVTESADADTVSPTPESGGARSPNAQPAPRGDQPRDTTTTPTTPTGAVGANVGKHNNYGGRLTLSQYVDAFGLLATARDVERETRDFYALDLERVQNEAALAAKNLYFNVLLAQTDLATQQEQVRFATEDLRIARARLAQGIAARFDVLTAETVLANAQQALSIAQDQYSLTQANLDYLLGVPSDTPITLQVPPLPPLDQTVNLPQATTIALQRRPEARQAQTNIAIAQRLVRFAGSALTPSVGLVGVAGYNSTAIPTLPHNTLAVTAQIDVPFDDGGATRARVRAAQIAVQTQIVTRNQLQLSVALEVQTAAINILDAQTRTRTATTALDAATEAVRVANVRYQNGLGTFLDVTNALAQLSQARTNFANAQFGYQTSLAALVRALGER